MQIMTTRITPATPPSKGAIRVLVDETWPEGLKKEAVDRWIPELAPSNWLLDRFGRDRVRWGTFRSRYRRQLTARKRVEFLTEIARLSATQTISLVTAAPAGTINHARIIAETLAREARLKV